MLLPNWRRPPERADRRRKGEEQNGRRRGEEEQSGRRRKSPSARFYGYQLSLLLSATNKIHLAQIADVAVGGK